MLSEAVVAQAKLARAKLVAFAVTRDAVKAKSFYRDTLGPTLGLTFVEESPFALVFNSNGTMLRIALVRELNPAPYTVLGWDVPDIAAAVSELVANGVVFLRYPGLIQDPAGIWNSPAGARVAWFADPDGNILSLTQF